MRTVLALAFANFVVWGTFLATFPGSHFSWPGSYKFWWFDDLPWAVLAPSVAVPVPLALSRYHAVRWLKVGLIVVTITTLLAFFPYMACSGGGV